MQSANKVEIMNIAHAIFNISEEDFDINLSPIDYDFDSAKVVQFIRKINAHFGIDVKMSKIFSEDDFEGIFNVFETAIQERVHL